MEYKRLTKREFGSLYSYRGRIYYNDVSNIIERLGELEDMIENGELITRERAQNLAVKYIMNLNKKSEDKNG